MRRVSIVLIIRWLVSDYQYRLVERFIVLGRMDLADAMEMQLANLRQLCEKNYHTVQVIDFLMRIPAYPLSKKEFVREPDPVREKELTWEDIIAEEPLEGEHWDDEVFDDDEDSMDESAEYERVVGRVFRLPPESEPYGLEHYALEIQELKLDNDIPYWRDDKDSFISGADSIRECLYAVLGYPTELFSFQDEMSQIPVPPQKYTVAHLSKEAFGGLLHSVAKYATIVRYLETFTDSISSRSHFPAFEYEFAFGVVHDIHNRLKQGLLQLEQEVKSDCIVSLITLVQKLQQLVSPYQPLVDALVDSTNQLQLLNNLYEAIYISETSNKTSTLTILLSAFIPILYDYFTCLNYSQFALSPYPDILTSCSESLRQIAHVTHHLSSLGLTIETPLKPRVGPPAAGPQTPGIDIAKVRGPILAEDHEEKFKSGEGVGLLGTDIAVVLPDGVWSREEENPPGHTTRVTSSTKQTLEDDVENKVEHTGIYEIENAVHRAIADFEITVSNKLKTYLSSCGLEKKIKQHIDIYFMLDQTGRMAQFLDSIIGTGGPLERHNVSNQLYEAFPDKTVSISKVENDKIHLKIPTSAQLQTIITSDNVDTYNTIWNKLLLCKSTATKQTKLPAITALNSIMIRYILILRKQTNNFFVKFHSDKINILTLHDNFVQEALKAISNSAVDDFIRCPTDNTPNSVLSWLNKPI